MKTPYFSPQISFVTLLHFWTALVLAGLACASAHAVHICPVGQSWQCELGPAGKKVCGCMPDDVSPPPPPPPPPAALHASQVIAGLHRACVLASNGSVRCWGLRSAGSTVSIHTNDGKNVAEIAGSADTDTICMIKTDRTLECVDNGSGGVLNISTQTDPALVNVTAVALSGSNACALINNAKVQCWGYGWIPSTSGVRGSIGKSQPAPITSASAIAVSDSNNTQSDLCAVSGGSVWCVGSGIYAGRGVVNVPQPTYASYVVSDGAGGFCANGVFATCWNKLTQFRPTVGTLVEHVSVGYTHTVAQSVPTEACALDLYGAASCWTNDPSKPTNPVANFRIPNDFISISVGAGFSCAIDHDRKVFCWGENSVGQLGLSNVTANPPVPVRL